MIIPNSVTYIGSYSFLIVQALNISNKLLRINNYTFAYFSSLKDSLIIPDSVKEIYDYAFSHMRYTSDEIITLQLSKSLTYIGKHVFDAERSQS